MSLLPVGAEVYLSEVKETVPMIVGQKLAEGYDWLDYNKTCVVRRNVGWLPWQKVYTIYIFDSLYNTI